MSEYDREISGAARHWHRGRREWRLQVQKFYLYLHLTNHYDLDETRQNFLWKSLMSLSSDRRFKKDVICELWWKRRRQAILGKELTLRRYQKPVGRP